MYSKEVPSVNHYTFNTNHVYMIVYCMLYIKHTTPCNVHQSDMHHKAFSAVCKIIQRFFFLLFQLYSCIDMSEHTVAEISFSLSFIIINPVVWGIQGRAAVHVITAVVSLKETRWDSVTTWRWVTEGLEFCSSNICRTVNLSAHLPSHFLCQDALKILRHKW